MIREILNQSRTLVFFLEGTYEKASKTIGSNFDFQKYFGHAKFFYSPFPKTFEKLVLGFRMGMFHFLNIEIFGARKTLSPVWVDLERLKVTKTGSICGTCNGFWFVGTSLEILGIFSRRRILRVKLSSFLGCWQGLEQ